MSTFPPPSTTSIDWSNVGFMVREVNGHIESRYNKTQGTWSEPAFVKDPFLKIHGMAPGLNYGQQVFEGQKAFRDPAGDIRIFRAKENATRMQHSAEVVSMPRIPVAHFQRCVHLAVGLNAEYVPPHETGAAMYIRPSMFGSSAQLGLSPPEEYLFVVFVMPTGVYHGVHPVDCLVLEDFDRAAPDGVGHAKVGGNYAPVLAFSERARAEGFGITLHLDSRTRSEIDEFSTSGFIGVRRNAGVAKGEKGEYTLVVPDSSQVIKSITSISVQQIAREVHGWEVEKRAVKYEELGGFVEVMAAGTAAALVPIKSITCRSRGDVFDYSKGLMGPEDPGEVAHQLLKTFKGIQTGVVEDRFGWCEKVVSPKGYQIGGEQASEKESTNGVHEGNVDKLA